MSLIQVRRGTATQWATSDPVLALGEPGYDSTNRTFKIGDGSSPWSTLPAVSGSGGAPVQSVNSKTGVVVLNAADVGASSPSDVSTRADLARDEATAYTDQIFANVELIATENPVGSGLWPLRGSIDPDGTHIVVWRGAAPPPQDETHMHNLDEYRVIS